VLELCVAITTKDYERLTKLYCDAPGLEPSQHWNNGQGQAFIFDMGTATLEVFNENQAETIDPFEAEKRISGPIRLPFKSPIWKQP